MHVKVLYRWSLLAGGVMSASAFAADPSLTNPAISLVLDGYYQNGERPMAERAEGFGLGETELAFSANVDDLFYGKLAAVLEEGDINLEEAFMQTLALPGSFSARAGRFMSDIGYLNNQHTHTDAFSDRPAVYRAFLGGHYFDDGVRLDYLAPTDLYWTMGVEAFKGERLRAADDSGLRHFDPMGVYSAYTKVGGDLDESSSWLLGLSYLRNQNGRQSPHVDGAASVGDEHEHHHGASYTGEDTLGVALVYKWAPEGNYKYQHLTLSGEYFRISGIAEVDEHGRDYHQGWYLSGVYQFSPTWSTGLRYGELDAMAVHEDPSDPLASLHDEAETQKLRETELSLNWHPSHFSTLRLQYSHQQGDHLDGIERDNIFTLQYVMTLGAHGAHQF